MLNRSHFMKGRSLLVLLLVAIALGHPIQPSAIAQITPPTNTQSTQLLSAQTVTEEFITLLTQQKFEQARQYLSPSLRNSWTAQEIEQKWQQLLTTVGPIDKIAQIRPAVLSDRYTVLLTIRFRDSTSDFVVSMDSNQKITALDFLWLGGMQKNAEEFVDAISTGRYGVARSFLERKLKQKYPPETLKQRWEAILAVTGPFKRRISSTLVRGSNSDVVVVNLEFEKGQSSFMIVLNPLSEIVGVDFPKQSKTAALNP